MPPRQQQQPQRQQQQQPVPSGGDSVEDQLREAVQQLTSMRHEFQKNRKEKDDEIRSLETSIELANMQVSALMRRVDDLEKRLTGGAHHSQQQQQSSSPPTHALPVPSSEQQTLWMPAAPTALAAPAAAVGAGRDREVLPPIPSPEVLQKMEARIIAVNPSLAQFAGQKHPCLRAFKGRCNYGDACKYAHYPSVACLMGLKGKCRYGAGGGGTQPCHELHLDSEEV